MIDLLKNTHKTKQCKYAGKKYSHKYIIGEITVQIVCRLATDKSEDEGQEEGKREKRLLN